MGTIVLIIEILLILALAVLMFKQSKRIKNNIEQQEINEKRTKNSQLENLLSNRNK